MSPEAEILSAVRASILLLDQKADSFIQYDHAKSLDAIFTHGDEFQIKGFLKRLEDVNVGEGISEAEAVLLAKLVNSSFGKRLEIDGKAVSLFEEDNPFISLLQLLRRYSLVQKNAIRIELHAAPQYEGPKMFVPENIRGVFEQFSQVIEKLDDSSKGNVFLKKAFARKTSTVTDEGKLAAVLRIIELGTTNNPLVTVISNTEMREALRVAESEYQPQNVADEPARTAQNKNTSDRRSFFKQLSEAVLGAALVPMVEAGAKKSQLLESDESRINAAVLAILEQQKNGVLTSDGLRNTLSDLEMPIQRRFSTDVATGFVAGATIGAVGAMFGQSADGSPPFEAFIKSLAADYDNLSYPQPRVAQMSK